MSIFDHIPSDESVEHEDKDAGGICITLRQEDFPDGLKFTGRYHTLRQDLLTAADDAIGILKNNPDSNIMIKIQYLRMDRND